MVSLDRLSPNKSKFIRIRFNFCSINKNSFFINFIFRNDYDFPIRFEAQAQDGALFLAIYKATE